MGVLISSSSATAPRPTTDTTEYRSRIAHFNGPNVGKFSLLAKLPAKSVIAARPEEPDNLVDLLDNRGGDGFGTRRTIIENGIDVAGIGKQPAHRLAHRRQFCDSQLGKRRLEIAKAAAPEIPQHRLDIAVGKRRLDADEILRLRPALKPFGL